MKLLGATTRIAGSSILSVGATSVSFGSVDVGATATQSLTLNSTGSAPVTISAAALTGTGFSMSGVTFPATLNSNQTATLSLQFDPATAGSATGQLVVTSNSSTNPVAVVNLSGTGASAAHQVDLSWDAPSNSPVPLEGYRIYRSQAGTTSYQLLNSAADAQTSYDDTTVQSGQTYSYEVKSVDTSGVESAPSNIASVTIP
ncbi:MAG: choice-of-anchor D domain-containing protein [Terracidiphilus sp.]